MYVILEIGFAKFFTFLGMPNLETVIISHTIIVSHITLFRQSTYLALKQVAKSDLSN